MVREPGRVPRRLRPGFEQAQSPGVQRRPPLRPDRPQDRLARQLVPKRVAPLVFLEDAVADRQLEVGTVRPHHPGEQAGIDRRAEHGGRFEHGAAGRRQASGSGERGIADRRRQLADRGQYLRHEEGVAASTRVEFVCVEDASGRELRHGLGRQARELQPLDRGNGSQIAEDAAQRVVGADLVVSVGDDDQDPRPLDAAAEEAQQVEGCLVGPVGVFDCQQRGLASGTPLQCRQHGAEEEVPPGAADEEALDVAAEIGGDVEERAERAGRRERVAGADQHPGALPDLGGEPAQQDGLADAGLATEQDEAAPAPIRLVDQSDEVRQDGVPLQQHPMFHSPTIRRDPVLSTAGEMERRGKQRPAGQRGSLPSCAALKVAVCRNRLGVSPHL
jgi:hypothetical protein